MTSQLYRGDLREAGQSSGIAGADAKCQARAQAAGLTGTYKAWLSGGTLDSSPSRRFANTDRTGPYVLPDAAATVVAADWADLTDGNLQAPIRASEFGETFAEQANTWTHTRVDGTPGGYGDVHCEEWTTSAFSMSPPSGDVGIGGSQSSTWTETSTLNCSRWGRLSCFEQG
jgi:hypothetical protein